MTANTFCLQLPGRATATTKAQASPGLLGRWAQWLAELRIATADGPTVLLRPVKPCARCPIPNVDPATGETSPEVLAALSAYRADPRLDGALSFGMNCVIVQGAGATLRVGDAVAADWRFD